MRRSLPVLGGPGTPGYQTGTTYQGSRRIRSHAFACSTDGGPGLPHGTCWKCAQNDDDEVEAQILAQLDKYAGARP